jgi:hypothetical protein
MVLQDRHLVCISLTMPKRNAPRARRQPQLPGTLSVLGGLNHKRIVPDSKARRTRGGCRRPARTLWPLRLRWSVATTRRGRQRNPRPRRASDACLGRCRDLPAFPMARALPQFTSSRPVGRPQTSRLCPDRRRRKRSGLESRSRTPS